MRKLSTFVDRLAGLSQPHIPAGRLDSINQAFRRRLDDAVEDVFQRACLGGDLDTAADLLDVLRKMNDRRRERAGAERRISDAHLVRARQELERRRMHASLGEARPDRG